MNIFDFDLAGIFSFSVSPLEQMLRGTLLYWFLFVILRFILQRRNMRREFITDKELNAKIRQEGVKDLATVKRVYLEADGEMSVMLNDEPQAAA